MPVASRRSVRRAVFTLPAAAVCLAGTPDVASAQVDARMFRYPAVSATQIAFVYAGDVW